MAPTGIKRVIRPAVAGLFYLKDAQALRETIVRLSACSGEKVKSLGVIVPHGGLHQSGQVIGQTLASVEIPRRVIILGPNHTGLGEPWSVMTNGAYATPLGEVLIDESFTEWLLENCPVLQADDLGHRGEHSIEVLLPFLRHLGPPDLMVTPVVIRSENLNEADQVADALSACLQQFPEPVLVIASADLAHYEPRESVQRKDALVIESIMKLSLHLTQYYLSQLHSCGLVSISCAMRVAKHMGAAHARLVQYGTSADEGGDPQSATGYAGMIIT